VGLNKLEVQFLFDRPECMVTVEQVTNYALEISRELSELHNAWVTPQKIISVLLERYSLNHFQELGVGIPTDVPVLNLVHELNSKLALYTDMFNAMQTSHSGHCGFISYRDLEDGALSMLRSFSLPALDAFRFPDIVHDDNEIILDHTESAPSSAPHQKRVKPVTPKTILEYGIGPLQKLPQVWSLFPDLPIDSKSVSRYLSRSDVLRFILDFRDSGGPVSYSSEITFLADPFNAFMLDRYPVALEQAGVRLMPDSSGVVHLGPESSVMFRSIESHHASQALELKRKEQEMLMRSLDSKQCASRASTFVPQLSIPAFFSSSMFFRNCIQEIEKNGNYSPSFKKALASVTKVLTSMQSSGDESPRVGSKRQKAESSDADPESPLDIPQLLTEYVMLRVGASKYRQGKFEISKETESNLRTDNSAVNRTTNLDSVAIPSILKPSPDTEERSGSDIKFQDDTRELMPDCSFETKIAFGASHEEIVTSEKLRGMCVSAFWNSSNTTASIDFDLRAVGRWGEALVYHYLMIRHPKGKVFWVNKDSESMACYDIKIEEPMTVNGCDRIVTTFIEVKSTRYNALNTFEISPNEWSFASGAPAVHYDIYRVYNAGDANNVRIHIVRDLLESVTDRRVRLCLAI
jgi:hypothetical protein